MTSDCGAVENIATAFHYKNMSMSQAAAAALSAGCDVDCGSAYSDGALASALAKQMVSQPVIDRALSRVLAQQFSLGIYDPAEANPYRQIPKAVVGSHEHLVLAREAAESGIVLLKNVDRQLPLRGSPNVAVLGSNGNDSLVLLGNCEQ